MLAESTEGFPAVGMVRMQSDEVVECTESSSILRTFVTMLHEHEPLLDRLLNMDPSFVICLGHAAEKYCARSIMESCASAIRCAAD